MLASTGELGRPLEIFSETRDGHRAERDPAFLEALVRRCATPNGIYGLKVFSHQFDVTARAEWTRILPGLRYVFLERHDLLGQAISYVRALQTRQYFASEPLRGTPRYDRRAIARHMVRIADGYARWKLFFARNGIDPLWLTYDELASDPEAVVRRVAAHLGLAHPVRIDPAQIRVAVQRDELTRAWRERFIEEAGDPRFLDHRLGKGRIWLRRRARDVRVALGSGFRR